MYQEYFRDSEWLTLPLITLVFFFCWFLVVLWRVLFRMRDKEKIRALATLPFADDSRSIEEETQHG